MISCTLNIIFHTAYIFFSKAFSFDKIALVCFWPLFGALSHSIVIYDILQYCPTFSIGFVLFILIQVFDHLELIACQREGSSFITSYVDTQLLWHQHWCLCWKSAGCRYVTSGFPHVLQCLCDNSMLCGLLPPCSVCWHQVWMPPSLQQCSSPQEYNSHYGLCGSLLFLCEKGTAVWSTFIPKPALWQAALF